MNHIRNVPELHLALSKLANSFVSLPAPDRNGVPQKWLSCEYCHSVTSVPRRVVATICEDCDQPCKIHHDCGLMVFEHDRPNSCEFTEIDP